MRKSNPILKILNSILYRKYNHVTWKDKSVVKAWEKKSDRHYLIVVMAE